MSMLTAQCDELRDKAMLFEGYNNGEISRMLRGAADTIESLRDRLQDATLGSWECEMEYIDTYEYPDGDEDYLCKCSKCGRKSWEPAHNLPKFCGGCGRMVKR